MHEIERDFELYLPPKQVFISPRIRRKNIYADPFRGGGLEHFSQKAKETFLENVDKAFGPLYATSTSGSIPPEWQEITNLLYKEKAMPSPLAYIDAPFNDEPKFSIVSLSGLIDKERFGRQTVQRALSFGASFDFDEAFAKALGEFFERYTLLHWKEYPLIRASSKELAKARKLFLDPFGITGISDKQRERLDESPLTDEKSITWVEGVELLTGKKVFLPAQLVFWNYHREADEPLIGEANTNGAGGMFNEKEAMLSGLKELIQRDGFIIFWLNTIAPPRLDHTTLPDSARELVDTIKHYHFRLEILDITTDVGLPAYASILIDPYWQGTSVHVGAGCGADATQAIISAILESLLVYHITRKNKRNFTLPDAYEPFVTALGHIERIGLWANPSMYEKFTWFLKGSNISFHDSQRHHRIKDTRHELEAVLERLREMGKGYEVYHYPVKNPLLKKFNYHVEKVIVPQLVPLYLYEENAPLEKLRLRETPQKLGYAHAVFPNPLPHPFP